jgi:hypothetical protein
MFRSQSPDTGYFAITYSNGTFVAVGAEKGWSPAKNDYGTEGTPVTAAGCSWSTDGVNWTDSKLPFVGSSTGYNLIAADGTGRLVALGVASLNPTTAWATRLTSTDNGKTWTAAARLALLGRCIVGGASGFVAAFNRPSDNNILVYTTATGLDTMVQKHIQAGAFNNFASGVYRDPNYFILLRGSAVGIVNNGVWSAFNNPAYGNDTGGVATNRIPRASVYTASGPVAAVASVWALVDSVAQNVQPNYCRDVWSAGSQGGVWSKKATLPAPQATTSYYAISYNNKFLFAVGDGLGAASKDGVNWQIVELPSGQWRGVATDGTDFVCVSADGDRIKISGSSIDGRIS